MSKKNVHKSKGEEENGAEKYETEVEKKLEDARHCIAQGYVSFDFHRFGGERPDNKDFALRYGLSEDDRLKIITELTYSDFLPPPTKAVDPELMGYTLYAFKKYLELSEDVKYVGETDKHGYDEFDLPFLQEKTSYAVNWYTPEWQEDITMEGDISEAKPTYMTRESTIVDADSTRYNSDSAASVCTYIKICIIDKKVPHVLKVVSFHDST